MAKHSRVECVGGQYVQESIIHLEGIRLITFAGHNLTQHYKKSNKDQKLQCTYHLFKCKL